MSVLTSNFFHSFLSMFASCTISFIDAHSNIKEIQKLNECEDEFELWLQLLLQLWLMVVGVDAVVVDDVVVVVVVAAADAAAPVDEVVMWLKLVGGYL